MTRERELTAQSAVDDNDFVRGVSEEGNSTRVKNSVYKTYLGQGTATPYIEVVNLGDDKGLIFTEQVSVGKPGDAKESVFGAGDSYGVGLEDTTPDGTPKAGSAWHCDTANTTGMTITSATEITTILASDTGSTTGLFRGTTTGKYILVGSDYTFGGVKAKIDTLGTVEPANVQGEYLAATNTWVTAPYMVTDSDFPYSQKGNNISTCSSCSEQWRFGFDPDNVPTTWAKVTLNINGTDYTKYWARFRITSDITLDPVIEQIKLHTNRFEINADGATEYFGLSRYRKELSAGINNLTVNVDGSAQNENIPYTADITAERTSNEFRNNFVDDAIITQSIPSGLDTSIPLLLNISYYPATAATGDVNFEADVIKIADGFVYDGAATATTFEVIDSITVGAALTRRTATIKIFVNELTDNDAIVIRFKRDATGGNTNDTLASNVVLSQYTLEGYFWKP